MIEGMSALTPRRSACPRHPTKRSRHEPSERSAIVVTLDADFHAILMVSAAPGPSVIRFLLQGLGAKAVVEAVHDVVVAFSRELARGAQLRRELRISELMLRIVAKPVNRERPMANRRRR